jgi:hypothetical protein
MRRVLGYIGNNLALIICFGLAVAAMVTGEYEQMEFFLILGMFAVVLNEVHENRVVLKEHMLKTHAFIEEEAAARDNLINSKDQQL